MKWIPVVPVDHSFLTMQAKLFIIRNAYPIFRCKRNCQDKVNPSQSLLLEATCSICDDVDIADEVRIIISQGKIKNNMLSVYPPNKA